MTSSLVQTIMERDRTATLTNKTITAPTLSGSVTGTYTLAGTPTLTSAALTTPTLTTPAGTGFPITKTILFTEDATSTTHTGTVTLPAGSVLHDIVVQSTVLWTGGTATLKVGDADDDDGWFTGVNLKATDLLVGEALRASDATTGWGGKNGVYLVAATGVFGQASATKGAGFGTSANSVIGVVTVGTPATTAGRTYMTVIYSVPTVTAATTA